MAEINVDAKSVGENLLDGLIAVAAIKVSSLFLLAPEVTVADQPLAVAAVAGCGALAWKAARSWVAFK